MVAAEWLEEESTMEHSRAFMIASWTVRGIAAVILLQTLFFKFTAAKESVYIFTTVGMEPWGRIGSGVVELIAAILLLFPRTARFPRTGSVPSWRMNSLTSAISIAKAEWVW
jgi:hypothetical protein